jgi:hypothetical protein
MGVVYAGCMRVFMDRKMGEVRWFMFMFADYCWLEL